MLGNTLQKLNFSHISLIFVGLMWSLPFLHPFHQFPLTTFYQEWWSAALGVLALTLLVESSFWQRAELPRVFLLPVMFIFLVMVQQVLGKIAYFDQASLYVWYFLLMALLMLLGARLRDCLGMDKVALLLAVFLLLGAEGSALIGLLQHYRWNTVLDSVTVMKVASGVYGNLAQPNHFANYVSLGLISLGLLFQQQRVRLIPTVLLAMPLLLVLALSGSRSAWLYLLAMSVLAAWWAWRNRSTSRLLFYCLGLLLGFALTHWILQLQIVPAADNSTNTVQRLLGDDTTGGIRLYLWREAWLMFSQSPWMGVGFGQFALHHFELQPLLQPKNITGLYNNAHNLIFQIAAEAGVAGLLILFASLIGWSYGLRRMALDASHWWACAILTVLGIHSLLEYPLWYAYFGGVAAILLGALDTRRYQLKLSRVGQVSLIVILLLGGFLLAQLRVGYQQLERVVAIEFDPNGDQKMFFAQLSNGLANAHAQPILMPYAEVMMSSLIDVSAEHLEKKLALNTRAMRFSPTGNVVYRQAILLALDEQYEAANRVMLQSIWSFPADFPNVRLQLQVLAEKDPAHFAALLKFATQKKQEHADAVHYR